MTDPAAAQALTPPSAVAPLVLEKPVPVAAVPTDTAGDMVPLDTAAVPGLDAKVAEYVSSILTLDTHSPGFTAKADEVRAMGDDDIRAAAATSNTLLNAPVAAMRGGAMSQGSKIAGDLISLRRTVEDLDPKQAVGVKKLLGMIPFGDKLVDYFRKYESAQGQLDAIVKSLYDGKDELLKDNAALEQEKVHLWETMQRLAQYVYIAKALDAELSRAATELDATDPAKAKALRDDVIFYVRQKHQDLLTQMAVSIQGFLAMDLIRNNNIELIKGVDRATTTTISALRTAVIVAQALSNQKLVLSQISALNDTTTGMIQSTSELLKSQSVEINKQAASSTIGIEALQAAFANIYDSMDAIDTFKSEALESMATTVSSLETEIAKSQAYLDRVQSSSANADVAAGTLDIPETPGA